ncbi:hypothetical protein ANO14919_067090 [Xylariales sp. No.14919]|nr:hypothetical protein ANO14919_067090 [Xylariales sp. No.14919]
MPPTKPVIANTRVQHTNETIWNTKGRQNPLDSFWAERFLVDPTNNTSSGFIKVRNTHLENHDNAIVRSA